ENICRTIVKPLECLAREVNPAGISIQNIERVAVYPAERGIPDHEQAGGMVRYKVKPVAYNHHSLVITCVVIQAPCTSEGVVVANYQRPRIAGVIAKLAAGICVQVDFASRDQAL